MAAGCLTEATVVVFHTSHCSYPSHAPFHPQVAYPEYAFAETGTEPNTAYEGVRNCFRIAGLDEENFGSAAWNPLRGLIRPGETVVLKPNMVKEMHPRDPEGWRYTLTHGSVVRSVADYVWKAVGPEGKIILADAPQTDSSFDKLVQVLGLDVMVDFYGQRGLRLELIDLRNEEWTSERGVVVARRRLSGDPYGTVAFDLGENSEFTSHHAVGDYFGADYDERVVNAHHSGGRHEYLMSGAAIRCDVLFSLPKLKTHKKAGITVSLKNLVGITGDKNWLPHHTEGNPRQGGDEHPNPTYLHRCERAAAKLLRRLVVAMPDIGPRVLQTARGVGEHIFGDTETVIRSGNWWGNDTVWRMALDLNKLLAYGNPDGSIRPGVAANRKRHLVLVDGIIAGEGRGPMNPDPVDAGLLVFGAHAPSVDAACAYLMGFDPDKIPIMHYAFSPRSYSLAEHGWREVVIRSNREIWNRPLVDIPDDQTFHFKPHFGWKGHMERSLKTRVAGEVS